MQKRELTWGDVFEEVAADTARAPLTTAETCAALFGMLREELKTQRAALTHADLFEAA